MPNDKPIYAFDIETDPFDAGKAVQPFCCGLYTGTKYYERWGKDCMRKMKQEVLDKLPPGIVYAHNGGKFDMYFAMDWFTQVRGEDISTDMLIIANRIVKANICGTRRYTKLHEFRDSYAIVPLALKKFGKDTVDYRTFTKQERVKHKKEILEYLKTDCVSLHKVCTDFRDRFGDQITIGSTAMKELRKLHDFDKLDEAQDRRIRIPYYYGGRVQCFEAGVIKPSTRDAKILAYDLNQCYPYVMSELLHPVSAPIARVTDELTDQTYFLTVSGRNHHAFPVKSGDGLSFTQERGIFSVSIHEYRAGIETGMFECEDILRTENFSRVTSFDTFVHKYHTLRRNAQLNGDEFGKEFYKLIGNSAYGKFAQSPDNYYNYVITDAYTDIHNVGYDKNGERICYEVALYDEQNGYILWKLHSANSNRYNVATGASITGGARSLLIRAIANAKRPLYCDTDSLICEQLDNVPIDPTKIGHWKLERTGTSFAIGGRKMYALFGDRCPSCNGTRKRYLGDCKNASMRNEEFHLYGCIKKASKGAVLNAEQITKIAKGGTVRWIKNAPSFNLVKHTSNVIDRTIRMTARVK